MNPRVAIVRSLEGDWVGLYVDGDLKAQGHDLSPATVATWIAGSCEEIEYDPEKSGLDTLPKDLKKVPRS